MAPAPWLPAAARRRSSSTTGRCWWQLRKRWAQRGGGRREGAGAPAAAGAARGHRGAATRPGRRGLPSGEPRRSAQAGLKGAGEYLAEPANGYEAVTAELRRGRELGVGGRPPGASCARAALLCRARLLRRPARGGSGARCPRLQPAAACGPVARPDEGVCCRCCCRCCCCRSAACPTSSSTASKCGGGAAGRCLPAPLAAALVVAAGQPAGADKLTAAPCCCRHHLSGAQPPEEFSRIFSSLLAEQR
jgi:hypothetical protein